MKYHGDVGYFEIIEWALVMDLKNMNVNCVKAAVAQDVANANTNTELAPDVSTCGGCLVDTSGDCGDADYPTDFVLLIKGLKGHVDNVQSVQK